MTSQDPQTWLPLPHLHHLVLLALAEGDVHGWALIKRIRLLSEGGSNPSSGSMYLALAKLEERGLVGFVKTPVDEDNRRQYYTLTRYGRRTLEAETARLEALVRHARKLQLAPGRRGNA